MALSNTQYNTLLRRYEAKQLENQHIVMERILSVYEELPRLTEIDETISSISVRQAKKLIDGDETALSDLHRQLQTLIREKKQLLADHGYPENYFEPPYACLDCKDTGYIGSQKCHCFTQAAIDLVYTQSNIRHILDMENFEHFSYQYYSDKQINPATGLSSLATAENAVRDCLEFVNTFDKEFRNLFFYGDTGIGKTYLSNCVAKSLLDSGHSVIYFTASSLFHILCNSFTVSQLFLCLNERILRRKSTIISTNLTLGQLAETYSERTFSRISSNYTMIKLFGSDIRLQKKLKRQSCQD